MHCVHNGRVSLSGPRPRPIPQKTAPRRVKTLDATVTEQDDTVKFLLIAAAVLVVLRVVLGIVAWLT
ncbi:hypothetical protein AWN90_36075 [Nocardia terpenica]|uniref:Uncharacterized protein n=1 Tax=Nocardia terpenica TaxID=455432 RepID=A0A164LF82_9NOCA|nr:hypothetical protein AWN90_36075 [Nocardia terpenica]